MGLPKPYYEEDGIIIYNANCLDILPHLPKVDLVLTDPPYGIGAIWQGGSKSSGWAKSATQKDLRNEWDKEPPSLETFNLLIAAAPLICIWGGNYFPLFPSRGWLVWEKPERNFTLAEAELAWTNKDMVIRVWNGPRSEPGREHPTQKPLKLMEWCIDKMQNGQPLIDTILDPFLGSGTTAVAAKNLGRKCIGVEISETYCEIAANRLRQSVLSLGFEKVEQGESISQSSMFDGMAGVAESD